MSKISIEIDTSDDSISATIDGKKLKNLMSVTAYKSEYDEGKLYLSMTTCTEDEGSDKHIHNTISLAGEGKLERVERTFEKGSKIEQTISHSVNVVAEKQKDDLRKQLGKLIASTKSRVNLD